MGRAGFKIGALIRATGALVITGLEAYFCVFIDGSRKCFFGKETEFTFNVALLAWLLLILCFLLALEKRCCTSGCRRAVGD